MIPARFIEYGYASQTSEIRMCRSLTHPLLIHSPICKKLFEIYYMRLDVCIVSS